MLNNISGLSVENVKSAYPWDDDFNSVSVDEFPRIYLEPFSSNSTGGTGVDGSGTCSVRLYWVKLVQESEETPIVDVEENGNLIMQYFDSTRRLKDDADGSYRNDIIIAQITGTAENPFTVWARDMSQPFIAMAIDLSFREI